MPTKIGVISDTHGLVRPEALAVLGGVDLIVHAGDIGKAAVLAKLTQIAPVVAVRGNVDKGTWAEELPETRLVEVAGIKLYLLHNLKELALDPVRADIKVVISGHSHQPRINRKAGVIYLNPGSAGPRRFKLPIALALLWLKEESEPEAEIVELVV